MVGELSQEWTGWSELWWGMMVGVATGRWLDLRQHMQSLPAGWTQGACPESQKLRPEAASQPAGGGG